MPLSLMPGIALGGLVTGSLIGGSASPVVAAVIPALVSSLAGALALLFHNPFDTQATELLKEALKESKDKGATLARVLRTLGTRRKDVAPQVGAMLVAFSLT